MKFFWKSVIILVGIALVGWFLNSDRSSDEHLTDIIVQEEPPTNEEVLANERADSKRVNGEVSRSLRFYQNKEMLVNDPMDRSKLSETALILDDPTIDEKTAMNAVYNLLSSLSITAYRGKFPAGLNVEITNSLLGKNAKKVGVLPMDSPRINDNGELIDMNNEPYWIHTSSDGNLKIHSAGPDRIMHTTDDLIFPAP